MTSPVEGTSVKGSGCEGTGVVKSVATSPQAIRVKDFQSGIQLVKPTFNRRLFTVCGWARYSSTLQGINPLIPRVVCTDSDADGVAVISMYLIGSSFYFDDPNRSGPAAEAPELDTWFFFAMRNNLTTGKCVWCYLADTSFIANRTVNANGDGIPGIGPADFSIAGNYEDSGGIALGIFGDVAQIRKWNASLSDAQLLAEKNSKTVVLKDSTLWSSNPLKGITDMSDESGHNRIGTVVGSLASVLDGPN
jgi:hypothetical protein